jgi:hypothetical protein
LPSALVQLARRGLRGRPGDEVRVPRDRALLVCVQPRDVCPSRLLAMFRPQLSSRLASVPLRWNRHLSQRARMALCCVLSLHGRSISAAPVCSLHGCSGLRGLSSRRRASRPGADPRGTARAGFRRVRILGRFGCVLYLTGCCIKNDGVVRVQTPVPDP